MKNNNNYTYNEEQLNEQLKAYPHLVQDCLNAIQQNANAGTENTQSTVSLTLRNLDRYNDVSKTKMNKLIASLVTHNRLTGWVSQRKHGFVSADQVQKAPKNAKKAASKKTSTKNGGRRTAREQIMYEEKQKVLEEYRAKVRKDLRKQYGLN